MFGLYRLWLALMVMVNHLTSIPGIGHHAVHGFFILSGYLMTHVMHRTYGYGPAGVGKFWLNRILRLYPVYWIVLLLSLAAVRGLGESHAFHYAHIYLPGTWKEIGENISMVYMNWIPGAAWPRLCPPTWSLTIELFFYLLISLGLSRSKKLTRAWLFCSVLIAVISFFPGYDYRYYFILSGALPFALGAALYHERAWLDALRLKFLPKATTTHFFIAMLINSASVSVGHAIPALAWLHTACFYLNLPLQTGLIFFLATKGHNLLTLAQDKAAGDFSYPVYLLHVQTGFVVSMLLFGKPVIGLSAAGILSCAITIIAVFAFSAVLIRFVDAPVQKLRDIVKRSIEPPNDREYRKES